MYTFHDIRSYFRLSRVSTSGFEVCVVDIKWDCTESSFAHDVILEQITDWLKLGLYLSAYSEMYVQTRRRYHEIITVYKSAPTTFLSRCPWIHFQFAERIDRPSPSGALVLFLGRLLNDRCLAVSQMQPWCSPHWACLNRCTFSHNTPFRLHLPALYSRPALNRTTNFCNYKTNMF